MSSEKGKAKTSDEPIKKPKGKASKKTSNKPKGKPPKRPIDELVRDLGEELEAPQPKRPLEAVFTESEEEHKEKEIKEADHEINPTVPKEEEERKEKFSAGGFILDGDGALPRKFNFALSEGSWTISKNPFNYSTEFPDSLLPCQYLSFGKLDYIRNFPTFIGFFYDTGLSESGASVVLFPDAKLCSNTSDLSKLFETVTLFRTKKQSVREAFLENKLIKLHVKTKGPSTIQKLQPNDPIKFTETSDKKLLDAGLQDLLAYMVRTDIVFAGDVDDSIFAVSHKAWNFMDLDNDLTGFRSVNYRDKADLVDTRIEGKGLTRPSLFVGNYGTAFGLRRQEDNLGSIYYLHTGAAVVWFIIPPAFAVRLEKEMANHCQKDHEACEGFILHKKWFVHPDLLNKWKIPFSMIYLLPGSYLILAAGTYYEGLSLGFNVGESINFLTKECMSAYKMTSSTCYCDYKVAQLPRNVFVGKYQPERYKAFIEGKDEDNIPYTEIRAVAMNDAARAVDYLLNHKIARKKNKGINAKSGKPYKEDAEKFDDVLFENLKKKVGTLGQ